MYSPDSRRMTQDARRSVCPACGALEVLTRRAVCYECDCRARGASEIEDHHILGIVNSDDTVPVPVNMHRALTRSMAVWPESLRSNPEHDPLITIAQIIRALADIARWFAERGERISDWLLLLSEFLNQRFGRRWYADKRFEPLW
jgi:hypothetical protein